MRNERQPTTTKQPYLLTGQRVTAQRRLLLNLMHEAGGHLDADELYRRAKEKEPRLSLSTVYRTLRLFKDLGLIDERHFDEEHHHLVCLQCGKVVEFMSPLTQRLKEDAERQKGFRITGAEVHLVGYCARCRRGKPEP